MDEVIDLLDAWLDAPKLCTHYMISSVVDLFGLSSNCMSLAGMSNAIVVHN